MFDISVITSDGAGLVGENCTYHLDTDQRLLTVETPGGTNFFNWDHVVYFGAAPVGA